MNFKYLFNYIIRLCVFGCMMLSLASCLNDVSNDYVPEVVPSLNEIETDHAARSLGVEITPVGVGNKSLHPDGEFAFRLRININLFSSGQCSMDFALKVHDKNFELVYAENIDLSAMGEFERLIIVQRPNQLKLYVENLKEQCEQRRIKQPIIVAFDVNKIYADIVSNNKP